MVTKAARVKRVRIEDGQNVSNGDQAAEDTAGHDEFTRYVDTSTRRVYKKRGVTRLQDIWNMDPNERIQVQVDQNNVPVGRESTVLSSFVGTIAKNDVLVPVDFATWKQKELRPYKIQILQLTSSKFSYPKCVESHILTTANNAWRNNKATLKDSYYVKGDIEKVFEKPTPPGILEAHWRNLVASWYTERAEKLSEINTANANQMKTHHTSGRKSFAVVADESEKATGKRPNRLELFKLTHKKPNEHEKALMEKADTLLAQGLTDGEEVFRKVFPAEHPGRMRGVGRGPTPTTFFGPSSSTTSDMSTGASTDPRIITLETRVGVLEGQVAMLEGKVAVLEGQVASLTSKRSESSSSVDGENTRDS